MTFRTAATAVPIPLLIAPALPSGAEDRRSPAVDPRTCSRRRADLRTSSGRPSAHYTVSGPNEDRAHAWADASGIEFAALEIAPQVRLP